MADASIGEKLFALGWRAGSVLPLELHEAIRLHLHHTDGKAPEHIDSDSWLIVVSQSCDIVVPKDGAELYVELLWAHPYAGKPRKGNRDLRSTRYLDFHPNREKFPELTLTAHATTDRFFVPRSALLDGRPDGHRTLSAVAIKRLHAWFALRYSRPAWPQTFVARFRPVRERLEDALNPLPKDVEIRIGISPKDEELDKDKYAIAVYFVVPAEQFQNSPETRGLVQEGFNKFVGALKSCDGIELNTDFSGVVSGEEFTWEDIQRTDLWDFAYLSPFE
jgi:hypothetical protein